MSRYINTIFSVLLVCSASAFASPKIGDQAPKIRVAEWITKKPPSLPGEEGATKHVFLIEFWTTWYAPCRASISHLNKLQEKHEKDGLVIVGISNEEAEVIKKFEKKVKMAYFVGNDDDMETSTAWTDDIDPMPYAFLVDKTGMVVWRGNPVKETTTMDRAIREVLAGQYDVEGAKNAAATETKYRKLMGQLQPALHSGDEEKILKIVDEMIALRPLELHPYQIKRYRLRQSGKTKELLEFEAEMEKNLKDSTTVLTKLVSQELNRDLSMRSPGLMLRAAQRVNELTQGRDAELLATLARVHCELGLIDAAIDSQTQAVGLAPEEMMDAYRSVLAYYKSVKDVTEEYRTRATAQAD